MIKLRIKEIMKGDEKVYKVYQRYIGFLWIDLGQGYTYDNLQSAIDKMKCRQKEWYKKHNVKSRWIKDTEIGVEEI